MDGSGFSGALLAGIFTLGVVRLCSGCVGRREENIIRVVVDDGADGPVCRRVASRVGTVVVDNRLGANSPVPSVQTLTGSVRIDIVAIRGTCRSLRESNFVRAAMNQKDFISTRGGSFCRRRRRELTRRRLRRTTSVKQVDKVSLRGLVRLLAVFCRRRSWL